MTLLLSTAAYVRKGKPVDGLAPQLSESRHSIIEETVWELLATPQTIESLQRAAHRETEEDRQNIENAMKRLLDADLIELSPDS